MNKEITEEEIDEKYPTHTHLQDNKFTEWASNRERKIGAKWALSRISEPKDKEKGKEEKKTLCISCKKPIPSDIANFINTKKGYIHLNTECLKKQGIELQQPI